MSKTGTSGGAGGWKKAGVALKNLFSGGLNRDMMGFSLEGPAVQVVQGEALAYALATNDQASGYFEKHRPLVSPLFSAVLLTEVLENIVLHPGMGMNVLKMVHSEQSFRFIRPIYADMRLVPVATVAAVKDVSTGQILEVDASLLLDGEAVTTGRVAMFVRGGKRGTKGGDSDSRRPQPVPEYEDLAVFSIGREQPRRYAVASRDYNPIHTRPLVARLAGFKAPIAQGMCVLACATAEMTRAYADQDPTRLAGVECRFAKPVYPGQELKLRTAKDDDGYLFTLVNPEDKPVLVNGRIRFS